MGSYSAGCVCGYIMTDTEYYDGQYGNPQEDLETKQ